MVAHQIIEFLFGELKFEIRRYLYKKTNGYGNKGVYIVVFRVLNNQKKEIIYIANFYNQFFTTPIIHYFLYNHITKQFSLLYKEFGVIETIIDDSTFNSTTPKSLLFADNEISLEKPENQKQFIETTKDKDWRKYSPHGFYKDLTFGLNLDMMVDLFVLALERNALDYMRKLWNSDDFLVSKGGWVQDNNISQEINTSMLNNRIFVVRNVDFFIEKIKAKTKNKGYNLSGPPKPMRHLHNRIDNYLSYFDVDFRWALYNHIQLHMPYCNDVLWKKLLPFLTYSKDFTTKIDELNGRFW